METVKISKLEYMELKESNEMLLEIRTEIFRKYKYYYNKWTELKEYIDNNEASLIKFNMLMEYEEKIEECKQYLELSGVNDKVFKELESILK